MPYTGKPTGIYGRSPRFARDDTLLVFVARKSVMSDKTGGRLPPYDPAENAQERNACMRSLQDVADALYVCAQKNRTVIGGSPVSLVPLQFLMHFRFRANGKLRKH